MGQSICLATVELEGLDINGGVGSYYHELAKLLSKNGWDVVVLFHSYDGRDIRDFSKKYRDEHGVIIHDVHELCKKSKNRISTGSFNLWSGPWYQARSHMFHEALQVLMADYGHSFDMIEFSEWGGIGFVPISMKKNLGYYGNSRMVVKLHSPSQWINDGFGKEWSTFDDIQLNYMERYAFENADVQVSPTQYLLGWCKERGWDVRENASVCRYPISLQVATDTGNNARLNLFKRKLIVFFGRYEERKGLPEFADAMNYIKSIHPGITARYELVFLGREFRISRESITRAFNGYSCRFYTLPRQDAVQYLVDRARLVVIPSRLDNLPNTIIECMSARIPFITSRAGGIPEMLGRDSELYNAISRDTDAESFGELILSYLGYDEPKVRGLLDDAHDRLRLLVDPDVILRWYAEKAADGPAVPAQSGPSGDRPFVTAIIRAGSISERLDAALLALEGQQYGNLRIMVLCTGSGAADQGLLESFKEHHPGVAFIEGYRGDMNKVISRIDTEYLLVADEHSRAYPGMVDGLVTCLERRKGLGGVSCYHKTTGTGALPDYQCEKTYGDRHMPIGPCLPLLFFENCQGYAGMFRNSALVSAGGWPPEKGANVCWDIWLKLLAGGYDIDVVRKTLYDEEGIAGRGGLTGSDVTKYIRPLIEKRPKFFYTNCYTSLHRLIRCPEINPVANPPAYLTPTFRNAAGDPGGDDGMEAFKRSNLYTIGVRLGQLANRSYHIKRALGITGKGVKRLLNA